MHFDDRLSTIFANAGDDEGSLGAVWCQLVDLLSQSPSALSEAQRGQACTFLQDNRQRVPERRRLAGAVSVAGRRLDVNLARLLCDDKPEVAAPVLARIQLANAEWRALLPQLSRTSRALLRQRRDLAPHLSAALMAFGPSDFALPASQAEVRSDKSGSAGFVEATDPVVPSEKDTPTISDLVRRIEAWRETKNDKPFGGGPKPLSRFAFETNEDGDITWVEGAPRAALIGLSVANATAANRPGVDGEAAGAFRKRDLIDGARLSLSGSVSLEGVWKLIARPFFDPATGRFAGYRGFAQRSIPRNEPVVGKLELLGHEMQPDSVRQLVHELRTPLNAIRGFAEMIEGEFLGPVTRAHRAQATQIVVESDRLLHVFEDLDIASQLAGGRYATGPDQASDLIRLVKDAAVAQTRLTTSRGAALQVVLPDMSITLDQDQVTIRRLLDRLLTVVIACASTDEKIRLSVVPTRDCFKIVATKPMRLQGVSLRTLFDSVSVGDEPNLPDLPLGVGFVFRLIDQLARQSGATLLINDSEIVLNVARESISARESREPR